MSDAATRIYGPAQPGTGDATLYTVAANDTAVVRNIHVMNTTGTAATISLSINGTSATAANCFLYQLSIPANSTYDWSGFLVLAETDTLQGLQGTGSALTVVISAVVTTNV